MSAGLALIVNAHGTMRDFPMVTQLPDEFEDGQLSRALERLHDDGDACRQAGERARAHVCRHHAPRVVAEQYAAAVERFHAGAHTGRKRLLSSLALLEKPPADEHSWVQLARSVARSLPATAPSRQ